MTAVAWVLVGYLAVLLGIGLWARRASSDMAGYYLAGKRLPAWVIAFSSNATGESAWLLLGLTGIGYVAGVHAFWVIVGEVLGVACAWVLVARPFKAYTDRVEAITVPDYLTARFRDRHNILRWIGTIIVLTMVTAYAAAQFTASGKAFDSFLDTGYTTGVWIGLGIVLFYTTVGGFKAVAYSDFIQGLLMLTCLVVLPIVGIIEAGGFAAVVEALRNADPDLLRPMGSHGLGVAGIVSAAGFVAIGFAFLGSPQLLTRFMAARDQRQIVSGGLWAVLCVIGFDVGAVFAGMAGRTIFPGLADPETILPVMSTALFPALLTGVFLVVVLAAIMSTVDSLLILASSGVVRDVVQQSLRLELNERTLTHAGRAVTVVIGLTGVAIALGEVRVIFDFVLFAWSGIASAFTLVVLCSLFWRRTTLTGAVAGMTGGFLAAAVWARWLSHLFHDLYEMVPGFLVGFACCIIGSLLTRPDPEAVAELDQVRKQVGAALRNPFRPRSSTIGSAPPGRETPRQCHNRGSPPRRG